MTSEPTAPGATPRRRIDYAGSVHDEREIAAVLQVLKGPSTALRIGKQVRKMACIPDLVWQFAQFAEERYRRTPDEDPAVHAYTLCSLNTRDPIALVDRGIDLTAIERDAATADWLMPNRKPLPRYFF